MKILFLVEMFVDDKNPYAGVFIFNQIRALQEVGYDVNVLWLDFRSIRRIRKWGFHSYYYEGIKIYRYSMPCGPIPGLYEWLIEHFSIKAYRKIMQKEGNINILHAHFSYMGIAAREINKYYDVPYVLTEHSGALLAETLLQREEKRTRYAYAGADKLIAVSSILKKNMLKYTEQDITVIPNILPNYFCVREKDKGKRTIYRYISVIGQVSVAKKIDLLVEAFENLNERYNNIELWIVGDRAWSKIIENETKGSFIKNRIRFFSAMSNSKLPEILQDCDCFVLPSIRESFGVVYIEAAGCGLPLIAAESGGPYDIINDKNGIIVPNNNLDELVKAMEYIFLNRDSYNAQTISEEAIRKFGEKAFVEKMGRIYYEVAET